MPSPDGSLTAAVPDPVPVNGIGYVVFDTIINQSSSALLIKDIDAYHSAGAREINLALNSPGGDVDAANTVVAEMNRLHATDGTMFKAWNTKLVASAATLIFLDAQQRYTDAGAAFLFHGPRVVASGSFDAETLRKDADKLDQLAQAQRDTLVARTHLTPKEAEIYTNRMVILSAKDAMQDGVVDGIGRLTLPKNHRIWLIKLKPKAPPAKTQAVSG